MTAIYKLAFDVFGADRLVFVVFLRYQGTADLSAPQEVACQSPKQILKDRLVGVTRVRIPCVFLLSCGVFYWSWLSDA